MKDTVTILDVAKRAGGSPATVTYALNGKRPVGEQTRAKVLSAIAELGYVPSWNASRLKSGSSGIIGCLAVDITESFVSRIIKGMESGLGRRQYSLLFVSAGGAGCRASCKLRGKASCHYLWPGNQGFCD